MAGRKSKGRRVGKEEGPSEEIQTAGSPACGQHHGRTAGGEATRQEEVGNEFNPQAQAALSH
jgi:hypothetical protein